MRRSKKPTRSGAGRPSPSEIRRAVVPKKSLSQRFLTSDRIREAILEAAAAARGDLVLEIGAGTGQLTTGLAEIARKVVAVEIDPELVRELERTTASANNVTVRCQNILELDLRRLVREAGCGKLLIVGNLPYHLTTQIILYLLEHRDVVDTAIVMVQKEYADRLLAGPGTRDYGAITLRTSFSAEVRKIVDVPPSAFRPRPRVSSTVLSLLFRSEPAIAVSDERQLFAVIRAAFGQRRKMLVNSLTRLSGLDRQEVKTLCERCGIPCTERPENLTLEQFAKLSDELGSAGAPAEGPGAPEGGTR